MAVSILFSTHHAAAVAQPQRGPFGFGQRGNAEQHKKIDTRFADLAILPVSAPVADEESLAISLSSLKSQFPWITDHKLGFAISQKTNLSKLDNWYYSFDIRFIQIMGIDPIGAQGSEFQANTFSLIEDLKEKFPGVMVQVDGGVHGEEILALKKAGADSVVMGSAIFAQGNPAENLKRFQDMVQ